MTHYPLMGVDHVTGFLKYFPNHIFGVGANGYFKCRVLIDIDVY